VNPDMRRYTNKLEAPRHYIDIDVYGDSALWTMPRYWKDAVAKYTEDTLLAYGVVPWHINKVRYELTNALQAKDASRILRYSADIGHYIADANVPLHTTVNYNGQLTGQRGIHGFWESRLPELFFDEYDFFVGKASYLDDPQLEAWRAVTQAHLAMDSVLRFERELSERFDESKKYSFEQKGASLIRVYSYDFSKAYHEALGGMVERQMRSAVKMVGDFWFTCWVDAGQPDLQSLGVSDYEEEKIKVDDNVQVREHESGSDG
ncbi:MAG: zinc dependent phospholipase C family protein, partial [Bacteroidota bacterium]